MAFPGVPGGPEPISQGFLQTSKARTPPSLSHGRSLGLLRVLNILKRKQLRQLRNTLSAPTLLFLATACSVHCSKKGLNLLNIFESDFF